MAALAGPPEREDVRVEPLSEGVWLHVATKVVGKWGPVRSNGLVVDTPDGVWLIDTAWDDDQTGWVLDWVATELQRPVVGAVVTHAHEDKMGGMAALHAAGVATYASSLTNALAPAAHLLPAQHSLDLRRGQGMRLAGVLQVLFPGAGHTRDNLVVAVGDVVHGGCLIRAASTTSLGNTADGDVRAWARSVRRVARAFPEESIVVPSHGEPGGRTLFHHTIARVRAHKRSP